MNITNSTLPVHPEMAIYPTFSRELWYWLARGIIAIITIFGNGLVIYLISSRVVLREQPSPNWFVLSMAVADFCVGFINFPLNIYFAFTLLPSVKDPGEQWAVLSLVQNVSFNASVTNLVLLTLDRYLAVVHPFTYESFMTAKRVLWLIILAWGVATLMEIPYLVLDLQGRAGTDPNDYLVMLVIYSVVLVFLPSFFMIYAYGRIICVARRHKQKIKEHEKQLASNSSIRRGKMAHSGNKNGAMVTVGTLVLIFVLSNLVTEYRCLCYLIPSCFESIQAAYVFLFLRNLNSAPNFIVYAFMKQDFRRELRKTIRRTFR
ncbi:dopamine receptor 2 [Exaiptasia diaphana]|uniref:G-protein coupled receptors family 1 profile domain-containing protein n=1 Tax=Exaiptasia diaphana TaxID=2652724 RepID=A0A913Y670_EXADI|nr:dopamine receptor 2 [Exaiptasia diaphana]XP_020915783.1 dopamine receptor 2 [Exaiptasia diaphana]XP_020915784.1 dopamine receptor 2 [Exaiptasia diaphana]XP_020915786.1 dopamine receptor 2 [Exaiptasia diaphana]XP_020915787.1 dopamine receptor 2 [Exaiptasia diaphana]XP_020915788.1 dopamine receptor 2 [Exaiptasia diaphana]XP_020915789.1 dopamine receptor 2 [Exaiptasia diaphana]KXJ21969.1 5-hydroxytryptamine receptor 6 [Exaiptasia diaphana]